jgi:hypothetical protein
MSERERGNSAKAEKRVLGELNLQKFLERRKK